MDCISDGRVVGHVVGIRTKSLKDSLFYQASCFRIMDNIKTVTFKRMIPLPYMICCKMYFLSEAILVEYIVVNKTFCNTIDEGFSRSIVGRVGKSIKPSHSINTQFDSYRISKAYKKANQPVLFPSLVRWWSVESGKIYTIFMLAYYKNII